MKILMLKDLTREYLVPINYYNEIFKCDFAMEPHTHSAFEIMYCLEGSFSFNYIPDPQQKESQSIDISKDQFIFINTGLFHNINIITDTCRILNLEFEPQAENPNPGANNILSLNAEDLFSINSSLKTIAEKNEPFYVFSDQANVSSDMIALIEEYVRESDSAESVLMKRILMLKLFIDIARCSQSSIQSSGNIHLKTALAYIHKNFQKKNLSVAEIAAVCGISQAHLQRTCKRELGKKLLNVINGIRVEDAKYLLKTTRLNNSEISGICGFSNRQQLIYEFRKIENCTPAEYKELQLKKRIRRWTGKNEKKITEAE